MKNIACIAFVSLAPFKTFLSQLSTSEMFVESLRREHLLHSMAVALISMLMVCLFVFLFILEALGTVEQNPSSNMVALGTATGLKQQLWNEECYHGKLTRKAAESLLVMDGDFLVRESTTSPGQYVLSGLQGGQAKHLLLVDPEGKVGTINDWKPRTTLGVYTNSHHIISGQSLHWKSLVAVLTHA